MTSVVGAAKVMKFNIVDMAVHQGCYGIEELPEGDWYCDVCASGKDIRTVFCELCPNTEDKAYKRTDEDKWVHVNCAFWLPEPRFSGNGIIGPVMNVQSVSRERFELV